VQNIVHGNGCKVCMLKTHFWRKCNGLASFRLGALCEQASKLQDHVPKYSVLQCWKQSTCCTQAWLPWNQRSEISIALLQWWIDWCIRLTEKAFQKLSDHWLLASGWRKWQPPPQPLLYTAHLCVSLVGFVRLVWDIHSCLSGFTAGFSHIHSCFH